MPTKLVYDCETGRTDEVEMTGDELAAHEALRAHPEPEAGPTRAEQVDTLVAQGKAALKGATSLADVKAVFAATLDGLASIDGTGSAQESR